MNKSITVQATQEAVWKAIVSYRESQPHRRRIVSRTDNTVVVEESFTEIPMVGSTKVVYEEVEHEFDRIDFSLVEADHLSKFNGHWAITANPDGKSSEVYLEAEFDIDMAIPFKEVILNQLAEMDVDKRLSYIRKTAEGE